MSADEHDYLEKDQTEEKMKFKSFQQKISSIKAQANVNMASTEFRTTRLNMISSDFRSNHPLNPKGKENDVDLSVRDGVKENFKSHQRAFTMVDHISPCFNSDRAQKLRSMQPSLRYEDK